jgi:hypothetical protein
MKIGLILCTVAILGGFAASGGDAHQTQQARRSPAKIAAIPAPKPIAKPAPNRSVASAASRSGTLGGPVNKGPGINGTGMRPKTVSQ